MKAARGIEAQGIAVPVEPPFEDTVRGRIHEEHVGGHSKLELWLGAVNVPRERNHGVPRERNHGLALSSSTVAGSRHDGNLGGNSKQAEG